MRNSLLLRLLLLLIFTTILTVVYTNIKLNKKVSQIESTLLSVRLEQEKYSTNQASLLLEQSKAVEVVRAELTKAKKDSLETTSKLTTIQADFTKEKYKNANNVITSLDISAILNGVSQIVCKQGSSVTSGSASLWNFPDIPYAILTNRHVVEGDENCVLVVSNKDSVPLGVYSLNGRSLTFNKSTDAAATEIGKAVSSLSPAVSIHNYSLSSLRKCPSNISLGSPVVIIGFPAYAKRDTEIILPTIGSVKTIYRTVTNGIVSGYDTSEVIPKGNLSDPNYFISAKIDNGNSGGVAIAKDGDGLCVLGIPTWLTVGNYENQALVQNIRNVLPK